MITLIKFGGEIIEDEKLLDNLGSSIKALVDNGEDIVLVHGGGPLSTKISKRLGLKTQMVGGRRVTDKETLEVMKMVLPGIINSNVLSTLKKFSLPGVSVSSISMIKTHKRPPKVVSGSNGKKVDFGYVGDIDEVNTNLLSHLISGKYIPVVSPLSATDDGVMMNINADTVAVQIAKSIKAKRLLLITKIGGIFENPEDLSTKFSKLSMGQAKDKIKKGIIQGGMIPKLEESFKLLEENLDSFHIIGLDTKNSIKCEIEKPGSIGTVIVK